eukprot:1141646-Pelagomonas_calceolata.AAC.1
MRERQHMEAYISNTINSQPCTPILVGDMNATLLNKDRSTRTVYQQDTLYRSFLFNNQLTPIDAHLEKRPWNFCTCTSANEDCQNAYTTSRIDDILLPADFQHHPHLSCSPHDKGYKHSDHLPLIANIPVSILCTAIMSLPPSLSKSKPEKVLIRPISNQEKPQHALLELTYPVYSMLSHTLNTMNLAYQEALNHLNHLESACSKSPNRLNHLCGKSARTVVEDLAADVVNLLHECITLH